MAAPIVAKASLITAVADHLNRSDLSASGGAIEVAIQLAEQRFQRDPRVREPGSNNTVLPSLFATDPNWLLLAEPDIYYWGVLCELQPYLRDESRIQVYEGLLEDAIAKLSGSVRLDPNRTALTITTYATLQSALADVLNRGDVKNIIPMFIRLAEAKFQKDPRVRDPANNAALVPLVTTSPNWLLTAHPDVYLYGSLVEACHYLRGEYLTMLPAWQEALESGISGISGTVRLDPNRTALALASYANLQTTVADALNRGDIKNVIPVCVTLAEAGLRKDQRVRGLASTTYSITADDIAVPTTFRNLESWYYDSSPYGPIEIVTPDMLGTLKARYGASGQPAYAAIIAGYFRFAPAPTSTYSSKMTYWQTITALSSGVNWLMTSHPDIYLMATLAQMGPWVQGDPNALATVVEAASALDRLCEALHLETWNTQWSGTMRTQVSAIGG